MVFLLSGTIAFSAVYWVIQSSSMMSLDTTATISFDTDNINHESKIPNWLDVRPPTLPLRTEIVDNPGRFKLLGVVRKDDKEGLALISVNSQTARSYNVGSTVDGDLVLDSIGTRSAILRSSSSHLKSIQLDLPDLNTENISDQISVESPVALPNKIRESPKIRPPKRDQLGLK